MHVLVIGSGNWCRAHLEALNTISQVERITLVGRNRQAVREVAYAYPGLQTH